jgi:hypothetical protein
MKRWICSLGAAGSLVMCIAVVVVWVRSLTCFDDLCWTEPTSCINVVSLHGRLHLQVASATAPLWSHGHQWDGMPVKGVGYSSGPYRGEFLGFAKGLRSNRFGKINAAEHVYVTPYWFMLLATAVVPGLWLRQARRKRLARWRAARGLCLRCGYDLRASSHRCPECGSHLPQSG